MDAQRLEERRRFRRLADESQWYSPFALALTTGMCPCEYLALKQADIELARDTASVCAEQSRYWDQCGTSMTRNVNKFAEL
jgi:hypothetical protein